MVGAHRNLAFDSQVLHDGPEVILRVGCARAAEQNCLPGALRRIKVTRTHKFNNGCQFTEKIVFLNDYKSSLEIIIKVYFCENFIFLFCYELLDLVLFK